MPQKVLIEPEDLLGFIQRLSVDVSRFHCRYIPEKISVKGLKEGLSKWGTLNALTGITIGLVLAKYQPGLAAAAAKQMNDVDAGSAENLFDSVLCCYDMYAKEHEYPPESTMFMEISNWSLPHAAMKDFSSRPDLTPNPAILDPFYDPKGMDCCR